jgi:membrane associated rhomboid family serine protease
MPPARATVAIAAVTAIAWGLVALSGLHEQVAFAAGFVPGRFSVGLAVPDALPVWLTPLTATLVHGGLLHLAFNMLILLFCGKITEASIGPGGLVVLYLVGAYAAAGAQYLADPGSVVPMVGASGATSAVIGAYALLFGTKRWEGWGRRSALAVQVLWLAAAWVVLQLMVGLASGGLPGVPSGAGIAVAAHIGGFLAGLVLARPLLLFRYRKA